MTYSLKSKIPKRTKKLIKCIYRDLKDSIYYKSKFQRPIPHLDFNSKKHIIFICKGNICRSPFAEHMLRKLIQDKNRCKIESCGLSDTCGSKSPQAAITIAEKFGIDLSKHRSISIRCSDFQSADIIFTMDLGQAKQIRRLFPEKADNIYLLRKIAPIPYSLFTNIEDPYGLEYVDYIKCFSIIQKSLQNYVRENQ
jgi:protein-tyrosine phosphatase